MGQSITKSQILMGMSCGDMEKVSNGMFIKAAGISAFGLIPGEGCHVIG